MPFGMVSLDDSIYAFSTFGDALLNEEIFL